MTGNPGPGSAPTENVRMLVDGWCSALAQVFESMADERPDIHWRAADDGPAWPGGEGEPLWWEQPFQISSGAAVWVGAPRSAWEYAGAATLRAAGLETIETAEAKNTWLEILGQSLSALARSVGALLGREVTCGQGLEQEPGPDACPVAFVRLKFAGSEPAELALSISAGLLALISAPAETEAAPANPRQAEPETTLATRPSRTMDLLLDIELPVSISFGRIRLPMKDVLKLTTGSIVELDRDVNDPVEVLVNQRLVARGEVVVVDGNYGVRIQEIASREDRLRSVR